MNRLVPILLFMCCFGKYSAQIADSLHWSTNRVEQVGMQLPETPMIPFQFNACLKTTLKKEWIGGTLHAHYVTNAYWLYKQSFASDSLGSRYYALAQLYFDCYEAESRRLQERVNLQPEFLREMKIQSDQRIREQIAAIRVATNDGRDSIQMTFWEKRMDSTLQVTPRLFPPEYEMGNFQLYFDLDGGIAIPGGTIADYFNPNIGWGIGAGFRYKRFVFDYAILHTYPVAKKNFSVADFKFSDTSSLRVSYSSLSVGAELISTERWSVVPLLGIGGFRVINRNEPKGSLYEKGRISLNVVFGLQTEWRFNLLFQSNQAQFFWKLIFKAGYMPIDFLKVVPGNSLNIQLGIGYTLRTVKNVPSFRI